MSGRRTDPALVLRPQELRLAYGLSATAALAFVVIWTPWNGGTHLVGFLLALVFTAALAGVASRGHRLWTGFVSFLLGVFGPWGFAYLLGAAYAAFGFWLAWRAHRAVKASVNVDPELLHGRATPLAPPRPGPLTTGRVTPKGTGRRRGPRRS